MNTSKVEQNGTQQITANQSQSMNNSGNNGASSIWGFQSAQANGSAPSSGGDQQKMTNLWSLPWSEGAANEGTPNPSGTTSTPSNPSGPSVWGMGGALEDLMSNPNGNDKVSGNANESRSAQQTNPANEQPGTKLNWSSAGGNTGDSPTAGGGNSGVISPGGSSNGSVSGISASDSKLISQWIGDSSGNEGQQTALTGTNAWGSNNAMNNSTSNPSSGNSNWGHAGNSSSDAAGSWQQSNSSQQQQQDQSWNSQGGPRVPTSSVRSYSQAATGNANQQGPPGQQQSQGFSQQVPSGNQNVSQQQNVSAMGSASSPCSPPLIESYIDTRRDDEMRQLVENCEGWGQRGVNQETTWDVEDVPEAKPRTDENPNVWPTFVNKGTNAWEESCRRRKVTPGSHHAPPLPSGWGGESHPPKPVAPPADAWNKWTPASSQPPTQPNVAMPWTGHGNLENRHSGGNWAEDSGHRSVPSSRDESPMGPGNNGQMWPNEQSNNNTWNNNSNNSNRGGIGTWQQTNIMSPANTERVSSWTEGIGQWTGPSAPVNKGAKGSSSGDSVSGDFEVEQWNNPGNKDNDYGEFEDMLPKRWSSASSQPMPPTGGMGPRRPKSDMMPPTGPDSGFMGPQRSALTDSLMQLGVSKEDATKALINSDNDYSQAIRWLVQQGKLAHSILNSPAAMMGPRGPQGDMFGQRNSGSFGNSNAGQMPPSGQYPPGSPNHMMPNQQQPAATSLQERIRQAQQRSQTKLNALPPSSNQVIVEQLRKAVHQGYLNQHVLNMQLSQDVLKLIHDLINHQIVLEQVQREDQQHQQQMQQMQLMKMSPMSPQVQAVDQQRQALQHEMCRIRLIMEQRKMQIAQRTGTAVAPTPGVPQASGAQSPVGGQSASSMMSSQGRSGRSGAPAAEFSQLSLGGGANNSEQSKLMQWRMNTTPERTGGDSRSTPNDNWMTMPNSSGFSPNSNDNRSQQQGGVSGGPAVVEFVPGKPWAGLSMQSTEDDPHMTPASAAKPPLAIGSDSYLDNLAKNGPGQMMGGRQASGSSPSPRPAGQSWGTGGGAVQQMQYGARPQSSSGANWGSPWGTGASVSMSGSGMPSDMDPGRFLPWGLTGSSAGNNNAASSYDPSRLAGNFM